MNKFLLVAFLAGLILAGCGGNKNLSTYYFVLETPVAGQPDETTSSIVPIPGVCVLAGVEVSPAYATHQIALRDLSHRLQYFSFNEWAVRPHDALSQLLEAHLMAGAVFEEIRDERSAPEFHHLLETFVHQLEMEENQQGINARLHVTFQLTERASGKVIRYQVDRREILSGRSLNEFAESIGRMFTGETDEFLKKVRNQL